MKDHDNIIEAASKKAFNDNVSTTQIVESCQDRPLITFALFAYNQEQFIEEAVQGAFSQTYSPLEIILSDDGSSDQTFAIISRMESEYCGPHKIILTGMNKIKV